VKTRSQKPGVRIQNGNRMQKAGYAKAVPDKAVQAAGGCPAQSRKTWGLWGLCGLWGQWGALSKTREMIVQNGFGVVPLPGWFCWPQGQNKWVLWVLWVLWVGRKDERLPVTAISRNSQSSRTPGLRKPLCSTTLQSVGMAVQYRNHKTRITKIVLCRTGLQSVGVV